MLRSMQSVLDCALPYHNRYNSPGSLITFHRNAYRFAKTTAPPKRAPIPMAAVLTAAGLLVPVAEAAVLVAVAEFLSELTLEPRLLVSDEYSEPMLLATDPVAVARTELRLLARLAASDVMLATSDDSSDRCDDTLAPMEAVPVRDREWSDVNWSTAEAAAVEMPSTMEEASDSSPERASVALCRMPPGLGVAVVVVSWA